jgi:hypothetical protein
MISSCNPPAFYQHQFKSFGEALRNGFNEEFWRWGLTFNQGNEMNVSQARVHERLDFIASRLLRSMHGNRFRRKNIVVRFVCFEQGSAQSFNRHYHVLMGIQASEHSWTDGEVAQAIETIDLEFTRRGGSSEKPVHIDYDWRMSNWYHSYCSRDVQYSSDANWFFNECKNRRRLRERIRSH